MAFDLTDLSDYVDENREGLIGKTVTGGKSIKILDLQTGFKSAGNINRMDTDAIFQDGSACGRTPLGTTSLSPRTLTVGEIKVEEDLCPKDLNKKYTQHQVKAGSKDDEIPFAKEYTDKKIQKINKAKEVAIWQGDILSGDGQLNKFDGLIKLIDAEVTVIDGNVTAATAITVANVIAIVRGMYDSLPADLIEAEDGENTLTDLAVLCGSDVFRLYITALENANLYHYTAENKNLEYPIPGTNARLIALGGLTGTDRLFAGRIGDDGGFVVGVDLENEEEDFDLWYSKEDKVVKFDAAWKMGTQIKWPEEIVEFTLVP
jgi:hypothetical protein